MRIQQGITRLFPNRPPESSASSAPTTPPQENGASSEPIAPGPAYASTTELVNGLLDFVRAKSTRQLTYAEVETELALRIRELMQTAMEDHFALRTLPEVPLAQAVDGHGPTADRREDNGVKDTNP